MRDHDAPPGRAVRAGHARRARWSDAHGWDGPMTATTGTTHAEAAQPTRWIRWLLVAVHISVVSWPVAFTILSSEASSSHPDPVSPVLAGLAVLALQLWHSLAVAAGRRPRG